MQGNNTSKSSLKILIADDETGMTEFLEKALITAGHAPTVFHNPLDVLHEFNRNAENYDLVITDQLMSRMTGVQLTQELLKTRPDFPVLIYAGWNDTLRSKADLPSGNVTLIKRPAPFNEILTFLNAIQPKKRHFNESTPTFCLIYASQAADNFSEKDLIDILKVSRSKNEKANLTGVIIFHNGYFLQMLEGDFATINKLFYEHICKDARHCNVITLFQEYREKREFPDWNMGFYGNMNNPELDLLKGYTDLNQHPAAHFFNEKVLTAQQLLRNFQF
jgi:DNA-binding response OmpR family regulator